MYPVVPGAMPSTSRSPRRRPSYTLSVPVEIVTEAGAKRFDIRLDGESASQNNWNSIPRPVSLRVDPDYILFRQLLEGEAPPILRDVLLDRNARTYILHQDAAEPGDGPQAGRPHARCSGRQVHDAADRRTGGRGHPRVRIARSGRRFHRPASTAAASGQDLRAGQRAGLGR